MAFFVHMTQGICMLFSPVPVNVTSVSMMYAFPDRWAGLVLFLTGLLALYGSAFPLKSEKFMPVYVLAVMPQQVVMFTSAWAALDAMHIGHFADGAIRTAAFITVDQCIYPIMALCHFAAAINHFISDPL